MLNRYLRYGNAILWSLNFHVIRNGCALSTMVQSNRRSSKSSSCWFLPSPQHYSLVIKGFVFISLALAFYLNYQFSHSITHGTAYNEGDVVSSGDSRRRDYLSLPHFPNNLPTSKSTALEWWRQTEKPMIGLYEYSPISTIQLPTSDLEEQEQKLNQNQIGGKYTDSDGGASNDNDIVVLTRKGHKFNPEDGKRTPNQDRVLVLSKREYSNGDKRADEVWWMGLFDGHGYYGHLVSQYVSSEFARRINEEWENENTDKKSSAMVKSTLRAIFLGINRSIPNFMRKAGCTGISVLRRGDSLYISNVGDSLAFVARYDSQGNIEIIYSTRAHKPDTPSERKRIEDSGGRVQDPPFDGATARLIIPQDGLEVGLAMSRSFGDHDGESVGLTVEPDTDVLDLSQFDRNQDYIVVAVTDGLVDFDKLSKEEVALVMAKALSSKEYERTKRRRLVSAAGTDAARELILKSSLLWEMQPGNYRDDISIVAHKLTL